MQRTLIAIACLALLAGCSGNSNVAAQEDDYAGVGPVVAPAAEPANAVPAAGAPVSEIRAAKQAEEARPQRFAYLGGDGDQLPMAVGVLRDRMTGCEYVITTQYQADVQATPRMQTVAGRPVQRCVEPSRDGGYTWIGTPLSLRVSTLRDAQTGCEYVTGSAFQETSFVMPRMRMTDSGEVAPLCRDKV